MGPCRILRTPRAEFALAAALLAACGPAPAPAHLARSSVSPAAPIAMHQGPIEVSGLKGRIVFSDRTNDIWMVNADGSGLHRLTTNPANDFDPARSPDGSMVAFRSERDGNNEVYVMQADGSDQHDVSRDRADDWGPTWSPDGRVLWNCARGMATGFRACVVAPKGTAVRVIPADIYVEYPSWSPDGSRIAFMSQEPDAAGDDPNYDVFVMNADGSRIRQLTDFPGEDGFPSWSPDGSMIAFTSTRDDCSHSSAPDCLTTGDIGPYHTLYVMDADGSSVRRVTNREAMLVDWSPDGRYLVFSPGLNVIRLDGTGLASIPVSGGAGEPEFADWSA